MRLLKCAVRDSGYQTDKGWGRVFVPVDSAMSDNKLRRPFLVCYRSGNTRSGVVYAEGNIMMDDGELFSRLDQLVTAEVSRIEFSALTYARV